MRSPSTAKTYKSSSTAPEGTSRPLLRLRLTNDDVGFGRVRELPPAVLGGGAGHLDQRRFDPLGDLDLLLIAAPLKPVDVDEGHRDCLPEPRSGALRER